MSEVISDPSEELTMEGMRKYAGRLHILLRNQYNLLSNAIKFTDKKGRIRVYATPSGNQVEVAVGDTGLGLILCKEFIEKHGGTIRAESEPGKGTTFRFTLPVGS